MHLFIDISKAGAKSLPISLRILLLQVSVYDIFENLLHSCVYVIVQLIFDLPVQTVIDSVVSGQVHYAVSNGYTAPIH